MVNGELRAQSGSMKLVERGLPTKNGVGPSVISLPSGGWATLIDFLCERFPGVSRQEISTRMQRGDVTDESGTAVSVETEFRAHTKLFYYRDIPNEIRVAEDEVILFQDDLIVAADKPHFLPVTPGGRYVQESLLVRLKRRLGIDSLAPMHRIDRETAGVVLFSVQPNTRAAYQSMFENHRVSKRYLAVAPIREGLVFPMRRRSCLIPDEHFMKTREVESAMAPNAETWIALRERRGDMALYELHPVSGKKHQLRVQMASLGIPIANDRMYPTMTPINTPDDAAKPLQLLAAAISFIDPITAEARQFETTRSLSAWSA